MNRRHGVLLGLLVAAAWLALFGDKTPHDPVNDKDFNFQKAMAAGVHN